MMFRLQKNKRLIAECSLTMLKRISGSFRKSILYSGSVLQQEHRIICISKSSIKFNLQHVCKYLEGYSITPMISRTTGTIRRVGISLVTIFTVDIISYINKEKLIIFTG